MKQSSILVSIEYVPGGARELKKLAAVGEDDESDLSVAEHGELVSLLEEAIPPLGERHLPVDLVLDPLQLQPSSLHPSLLLLLLLHTRTHADILEETLILSL